MSSLRRVVIASPGGYSALQVHPMSPLTPRHGEVVVAVTHAGVNFADCIIRMGLYESARVYEGYPLTPGFEFVGTVVSHAPNIHDLAVGDVVMGVSRFHAQASHVRVPRHHLFALPQGFSRAQASAFPSVFLTAWYALHTLAQAQTQANVLVHSAAGGVGGALVQLARAHGCHVTAVVGHRNKIPVASALGAHEVLVRTSAWDRQARMVQPRGFHAVFDANGATTLRESLALLCPTGRLVIYGFHSMLSTREGRVSWARLAWDYLRMPRFNPLDLTGTNRSVMGFNLSYLFEHASLLTSAMHSLGEAVARGDIRALGVTEFPVEQVVDAHRALESGQTTGKLVLTF